eukprot:CAMPEP_0194158528 /NCGR_PEP_ID=MMETSP0152-20130528/76481_1 /TAXON_ID=1049557 /ORGANISM="Thalassiothrix antarctica, Strain L6-D1" /LENGTH=62 /DNA_ID=CAMNT_0038867833 /DNA_START=1219 /DNA_END=1404 /DNA_ORIENTATION=-
MVAHEWDVPVIELIDSLLASDNEGPFWVCAFSIYWNNNDAFKNWQPTISDQLSSSSDNNNTF